MPSPSLDIIPYTQTATSWADFADTLEDPPTIRLFARYGDLQFPLPQTTSLNFMHIVDQFRDGYLPHAEVGVDVALIDDPAVRIPDNVPIPETGDDTPLVYVRSVQDDLQSTMFIVPRKEFKTAFRDACILTLRAVAAVAPDSVEDIIDRKTLMGDFLHRNRELLSASVSEYSLLNPAELDHDGLADLDSAPSHLDILANESSSLITIPQEYRIGIPASQVWHSGQGVPASDTTDTVNTAPEDSSTRSEDDFPADGTSDESASEMVELVDEVLEDN